jgi:hypothetical protein
MFFVLPMKGFPCAFYPASALMVERYTMDTPVRHRVEYRAG